MLWRKIQKDFPFSPDQEIIHPHQQLIQKLCERHRQQRVAALCGAEYRLDRRAVLQFIKDAVDNPVPLIAILYKGKKKDEE